MNGGRAGACWARGGMRTPHARPFLILNRGRKLADDYRWSPGVGSPVTARRPACRSPLAVRIGSAFSFFNPQPGLLTGRAHNQAGRQAGRGAFYKEME